MSLLQTMTAPAEGHRPPDLARDVTLDDIRQMEPEVNEVLPEDPPVQRIVEQAERMDSVKDQNALRSETGTAELAQLSYADLKPI